jgi:hypothetical protein
MSPRRSAATLVSVLVILTIIVVLIGLLLPAVGQVRHAAARARCANSLKQLWIAVVNKCDTDGHFGPGTAPGTTFPPDRRMSFYPILLPYLECQSVYTKLAPAQEWDSPANVTAAADWPVMRTFQCPEWSEERWEPTPAMPERVTRGHLAYTNYIGVAGLGTDAPTLPADDPRAGMFGYDRTLRREDVKDGLSNTALLLETGRDVGAWMQGGPSTVRGIDQTDVPITGDGQAFGGTHFSDKFALFLKKPSGSNLLLADGSVRYLLNETDPSVLAALATIAGGESIPPDW